MRIIADADLNGKTIYSVLRTCGASGTLIKLLKARPHGITLNGADVTVRAVVREGDIIVADDADTYEDENDYIFPSEDIVDIIYEDEGAFVVNKPSGMPTHTSHGHYLDTLANALCAEYRRRGLPFVFRAVNRLDADTSGAVLLAKSKLSSSILARHMAAGNIKKTYIAVLDGILQLPCGQSGKIVSYIKRRADTIILRESVPEYTVGADFAETNYTCLYKCGGHTIVAAEPVTGRTHQLRVHFSSIGHPITGDELYGGSREFIGRQALHAYRLTFPASSGTVTVTAPIPDDILKLTGKQIDF